MDELKLASLHLNDPDPNYTWSCSAITLQANKEGFFRAYAEQIEGASNFAKFSRLSSDEERLKFCMRLPEANCLEVRPFYREKSALEAADLRVQAELFLKVDNPKTALQLLNRSIIRSPSPGPKGNKDAGHCLARSLALRSEALLKLGRHALALRDSQYALAAGLPLPEERARVLRAQGCCYEATNQMLRAKLAYLSSAKLLESSKSPENQQLHEEVTTSVKRCETAVNKEAPAPEPAKTEPPLPELFGGASERLPHLSRVLGVEQTEMEGRFVTALEDIPSGSTLAVEPAFVAALLPEKAGTHCHHCFARLEAPLACPVCSGVAFCGPECQAEACETYHKIECQFSNLFIGSGMSVLCYLALRLISREGTADKFCKLWNLAHQQGNTATNKKTKKNKNSEAESTVDGEAVEKYKRFLALVGHENLRSTKDFIHRTAMAIFLLKCLQKSYFFPKASTLGEGELSAEEKMVGSALLRHLQILQFNAHEVFETLARTPCRIKGSRAAYLGVAVYTSAALLNHDCYPATGRCFNGTTMMLHSLRPLKAGAMVGENYGPIVTKRTTNVRQKGLRSRYWFDCKCQACLEDWPTYDQGMPVRKKDQIYSALHELGIATMESENLQQAILLLSNYLDSVHHQITLPDKEVCLTMDALRLCLASHWGTVVVPEQKEKLPQSDELGLGGEFDSRDRGAEITEYIDVD